MLSNHSNERPPNEAPPRVLDDCIRKESFGERDLAWRGILYRRFGPLKLRRFFSACVLVGIVVVSVMLYSEVTAASYDRVEESIQSSPMPEQNELGCSTHAWFLMFADPPYRYSTHSVFHNGAITLENRYCGSYRARVLAMTKVCGGFGCNWHHRGIGNWTGVQGTQWSGFDGQDCRSETNRYRTDTVFETLVLGFATSPPYPVIRIRTDVVYDNVQPEFKC